MRILNELKELHLKTDLLNRDPEVYNRSHLAARLMQRADNFKRYGMKFNSSKNWREDIEPLTLLKIYMARCVLIGESTLAGKYDIYPEHREKELEFNKGLWKIFCKEYIGSYIPELTWPSTVKEIARLNDNRDIVMKYSISDSIKTLMVHNQLNDYDEFLGPKDSLDISTFSINKNTIDHISDIYGYDGKTIRASRTVSWMVTWYKFQILMYDEPHENFFKEQIISCQQYLICNFYKFILLYLRNAVYAEQTCKKTRYPSSIDITKFFNFK